MKKKAGKRPEGSTRPAIAAKTGAASSLAAFVAHSKLFLQKFPKLPLLDRETSGIAIISVAIYFLLVLYVFVAMPPFQIQGGLEESPISKNSEIRLLPGERYEYLLSGEAGSTIVEYAVSSSPVCRGAIVSEPSGAMSICILPSGNIDDPELSAYNSTYGNRSILLFSPWMLAVSDGFSWEVGARLGTSSATTYIPTRFSSGGITRIAGRDAYKVTVSSEVGATETHYIDAEKRVLLKSEVGAYSARLVSAPFALNWTGN